MNERVFFRIGASGWEQVDIQDIEPDDVVSIYDNGERYVDPHGANSWMVVSKPYQKQYKAGLLWTVDVQWNGGDGVVTA